MENIIKVGVGAMILDGNKILLGHRSKTRKDTGGIYEPDTWSLPGGKQEYSETVYETIIREVKEETNLDIVNPKVFSVSDDFQTDRHFVTIEMITNEFSGEVKVMEPEKEDEWRWFDLNELPNNIYSPSKKFIEKYLEERGDK
jgi:ADP-ribose pyrophosphatase YjhB (NUDIX family)